MSRPTPPQNLLDSAHIVLRPAPEVWEWRQREILAPKGSIHNEEHAHLLGANIGGL